MTTAFDESQHPRGSAGKFSAKTTSAPAGVLAAQEAAEIDAAFADEPIVCAQCRTTEVETDGEVCASCIPVVNHMTDMYQYARSTNVREGMRTPWGEADHVTHHDVGISFVGTPGHGGIKLSPERNRQMPSALRNPNGWYEEDVEHARVRAIFPEAFVKDRFGPDAADEIFEVRKEARRVVRDWFPNEYEAWTGSTIPAGESHVKDAAAWERQHANDFVARAARASVTDPDSVVVTARRREDDTEHEYLVNKYDYRNNNRGDLGQDGRFVIDPKRHPQLPDPEPVKAPEKPKAHLIDQEDLGAFHDMEPSRARDMIARDLNNKWRWPDTGTKSLSHRLTENGARSRTAQVQNGKRTYHVTLPSTGDATFTIGISKATFDYLDGMVPDRRGEHEIASQDAEVYAASLERRRANYDPVSDKQKEKLHALQARARELSKAHWDAQANDPRVVEARQQREQTQEARERAATLMGEDA